MADNPPPKPPAVEVEPVDAEPIDADPVRIDARVRENRQGDFGIVAAKWEGPLPPPQALDAFERVLPGSAERIVAMTESEQRHRQELERQSLSAAIGDTKRGQWLGGAVAIVAVGGAVGAAMLGMGWQVVAALLCIPLVSIINSIVRARSPFPNDVQISQEEGEAKQIEAPRPKNPDARRSPRAKKAKRRGG